MAIEIMSEPPVKRLCTAASRPESNMNVLQNQRNTLKELNWSIPISPPVTPETKLFHDVKDESQLCSNSSDPVLYPEVSRHDQLTSLFSTSAAIKIESSPTPIPSPPGGQDNKKQIALTASKPLQESSGNQKSRIGAIYNNDPVRYLAFLKSESTRSTIPQVSLLERSYSSPPIKTPPKSLPRLETATPKTSPNHSRTKSSAKKGVRKDSQSSANPDVRSAKKRFEDVDFQSLPDFCPSATVLKYTKSFAKPDWPAAPLDLSFDADRIHLDDKEVALASGLRLTCATYLCSKRRIFIAKVNNLREGKDFRKTDAQQACKIDVNKASRLWQAFYDGGWFDSALFTQHL